MMLADREYVEPQLVGELCLLEQITHPSLGGDAGGQIGKCRKSKFHGLQDSTIVVHATIFVRLRFSYSSPLRGQIADQ